MYQIGKYVHTMFSAAVVAGLLASPSSGALVALKDRSPIATGGNLDTAFGDAITNATINVYTDAVEDTTLYLGSTSTGYWSNYGAKTGTSDRTSPTIEDAILVRFDLNQLPGFGPGSVITNAEFRLKRVSGNSGRNDVSLVYVTTQDWAEGNKEGGYPGASPAAEGASAAHPRGLNTGMNQNADGSAGTASSGSWGVNGDVPFSFAGDTAMDPNTVNKASSITDSYFVWSVTDIVDGWAQGTIPNFGLALQSTTHSNYTWRLSEYGGTTSGGETQEPTLFIEYTPVPEPVSLALMALSGLMLVRRRT